MKNLSLEEYEAQARSIVFDVMAAGDIVCVDCGDAGKFVIMEEPEYQIMRDALKTVLSAATTDKPTYNAILTAAKKVGLTGSEE